MNELYSKKLQERDIKPTAVRLLIFKAMLNFPQTFSLTDLEEALETVDKSTLFRTITLFHEKHLIHGVDDGSGSAKYSVCSSDCNCSLQDLHVHFYCNKCKKTFCMKGISIPEVKLPENFVLEGANFVLKGLCNHCSKLAT